MTNDDGSGVPALEGYVSATAAKRLQNQGEHEIKQGAIDEDDETEGDEVGRTDACLKDVLREGVALNLLVGDDDACHCGYGSCHHADEHPLAQIGEEDVVEHDVIDEGDDEGQEQHHIEDRTVGTRLKHVLREIAEVGSPEQFQDI